MKLVVSAGGEVGVCAGGRVTVGPSMEVYLAVLMGIPTGTRLS
jgi:hypothetical protein